MLATLVDGEVFAVLLIILALLAIVWLVRHL